MIRILNVLRIAEGASWTNRLQRLMTSHNRNKKLVSADVHHRRPVSCRRANGKEHRQISVAKVGRRPKSKPLSPKHVTFAPFRTDRPLQYSPVS